MNHSSSSVAIFNKIEVEPSKPRRSAPAAPNPVAKTESVTPPSAAETSAPTSISYTFEASTTDLPPPSISGLAGSIALDQEYQIVAVLEMTGELGESADALFRRKEHALIRIFGALSVPEARALHKRLSLPRADDSLAAAFRTRLVHDRQSRLIAFLADARRREATAGRRR